MAKIEDLKNQRLAALKATAGGPPKRTSNQFFGVGPDHRCHNRRGGLAPAAL